MDKWLDSGNRAIKQKTVDRVAGFRHSSGIVQHNPHKTRSPAGFFMRETNTMPDRIANHHDSIVLMSSNAAVGAGTTTAGVGVMTWLAGNAQAISAICMILGALVAMVSLLVSIHYQAKRDARESDLFKDENGL